MTQHHEITLAGRQITIGRMTMGELCEIEELLSNKDGKLPIALATAVVKIGIRRFKPMDMNLESNDGFALGVTAQEIMTAFTAIMRSAGFDTTVSV